MGTTTAAAQEAVPTRPEAPGKFWRAARGVLAWNTVTWGINRYLKNEPWSRVGPDTWWQNLHGGFEWDDDGFLTNQQCHPWTGALYFNSARASGYGFWASTPFAAGGSYVWEVFGENKRPSLNDAVNTTLGGIAIGEVLHRLAARVVRGPRGERPGALDQVAAFLISPATMGQWWTGAESRVAMAAAPERVAPLGRRIVVGYAWERPVGDIAGGGGGAYGRPFVELVYEHGSPFDVDFGRPYDAFDFRFSANFSPAQNFIDQAQVAGLLARHDLRRTSQSQLVVGAFQRYDYRNTKFYASGGQSFGGALLYRRLLGGGATAPATELRLGLQLDGLVLGGISSEHADVVGRSYDYGPGLSSAFSSELRHAGRTLARFDVRARWLHSVNGADADHLAIEETVAVALPVTRHVDVAGDVALWGRRSRYRQLPGVTRRITEMRLYLTWRPS